MLLAIDTATREASIALYNADGVLSEITWRSRENHTVELTTQVLHLLDLGHVSKDEIKAIGVALGPGSFTGLRVGMSVAKGWAFGAQIPLLAIPTLDAIARAHLHESLPMWAVLNAGRKRFTVARYTFLNGEANRSNDYALVDVDGLIDLVLRSDDARAFFCGDVDVTLAQVLAERLGERAVIASPALNVRRAGFIAELAWARFVRGESDDVASIAPMYTPYPI
jgi:tRNA threonylcarbamoyladenosine biosynthesis protein TsaB